MGKGTEVLKMILYAAKREGLQTAPEKFVFYTIDDEELSSETDLYKFFTPYGFRPVKDEGYVLDISGEDSEVEMSQERQVALADKIYFEAFSDTDETRYVEVDSQVLLPEGSSDNGKDVVLHLPDFVPYRPNADLPERIKSYVSRSEKGKITNCHQGDAVLIKLDTENDVIGTLFLQHCDAVCGKIVIKGEPYLFMYHDNPLRRNRNILAFLMWLLEKSNAPDEFECYISTRRRADVDDNHKNLTLNDVMRMLKEEYSGISIDHVRHREIDDSYGAVTVSRSGMSFRTVERKSQPGFNADWNEKISEVRTFKRPLELYDERYDVPIETEFPDFIKFIGSRAEYDRPVVALGTSWIKGYAEKEHMQHREINRLITALRRFCGQNNLPMVVGEDNELLGLVAAERKERPNAKVIVLAGETAVRSDDFKGLENAVLAGVNSEELTSDSYMPILDMLITVLKVTFEIGDEESILKRSKVAVEKMDGYYLFTLEAKPMDYDELRKMYDVQIFA